MANEAYLLQSIRQAAAFTRLLASYGCVEGPGDALTPPPACGECGPCAAAAWLEARGLLEVPARRSITDRELLELRAALPVDEWVRPMDVGGRDGDRTSQRLNTLVRLGYAEMKRRAGHCRPSYLYRRIP